MRADVALQVIVAPSGQRALEALSSYLLKVTKLSRRRLSVVFEQQLGTCSMKKFVSTYERITREGEARGLVRGRAEILLLQLARRFGALPKKIETRVLAAKTPQLDQWAERVLDAASLDDVFAKS